MRRKALILAASALAALAGCASAPSDPAALADFRANNDPLEPFNRKVFAFNQGFDRAVIRPVARAYVRSLPQAARDAVRNFVLNLNEPVVCANNVLQGQARRAGTSICRFVLDTTLGVGGLFDFARREGLPRQTGDLGQTLFVWGVPEGPYLVLPVLGPSNPRDAVGMGAQGYLDPYRYVVRNNHVSTLVAYSPAIAGGIDQRARALDALDALQKESIDYYAALRSLFRQNRAAQLRGDESPAAPAIEGMYDDPDAAPPQKAKPDSGGLSR